MKLLRILRRLCVVLLVSVGAAYAIERAAINCWRRGPKPPARRVLGTDRYLTLRDGAILRVVEAGEGPVIVLAHGIGGRLDHWEPIASGLAAAGNRVVAYDQRGHHHSTRGVEPFTPETLGRDLLEVIASTGSRAAVVVGHSMGGISIFGSLDHGLAEVADAVVLVSTVHKAVSPGRKSDSALGFFLALASHPSHGLVLMRPGFGANPHFDDLEELRQNWAEMNGDTFADAIEGLSAFDYTSSLRVCALRATVICGDADRVTPAKFSHTIAELLPDARLDVLADVGHMATWEDSSTVLRHIQELAAEVES